MSYFLPQMMYKFCGGLLMMLIEVLMHYRSLHPLSKFACIIKVCMHYQSLHASNCLWLWTLLKLNKTLEVDKSPSLSHRTLSPLSPFRPFSPGGPVAPYQNCKGRKGFMERIYSMRLDKSNVSLSIVCTLIDNDKLANQIARLVAIVVKICISL